MNDHIAEQIAVALVIEIWNEHRREAHLDVRSRLQLVERREAELQLAVRSLAVIARRLAAEGER